MKKLLFIVLDGGADTPNKKVGGKTAFEAANLPNIDFLSRNGKNGMLSILPIPPESDEAVISLLGYDVFKVYTGRGPLEAIGGGLSFNEGDLAIRCNFATLQGNEIVNIRAGGISDKEADELETAINQYVSLSKGNFIFKSTTGYRGVLVIKSKNGLSAKISNTHPGYMLRMLDISWNRDGEIKYVPMSEALAHPRMILKECLPLEKTQEAVNSATLVNEFSEKSRIVLENHPINKKRIAEGKPPANVILMRNAGNKKPKLYNLNQAYGKKWACFVDMPVERGIAFCAGMDVIPIPPISENAEQDMAIRVLTLLKNLQFYDAFYIHLKGPDVFAHLGDIHGKVKSLEQIDEYFFRPLLKNIDLQNTIVVVTCDHTTSCEKKAHTDDPVPVAVFGEGLPDDVATFTEKNCKNGELVSMSTRQFMDYLMKLLG